MLWKAAFVILFFMVNFTNGYKSYIGYHVYSYRINSSEQVNTIAAIENHFTADQVDIWKPATRTTDGRMMISPGIKRQITTYLSNNGIKLLKLPLDIPRLVQNQKQENNMKRIFSMFRSGGGRAPHTYYMRYREILKWIKRKAKNCRSELNCSTERIGRTHYNRKLEIIKISKKEYNSRRQKDIVWIDAGIHAREWISPSTALYVIDELLSYGADARIMLDRFDFYILPMFNPDGYEYTHTHTRFWRKNLVRSMNTSCYGVDLNRNWGYKFGGSGASNAPCMENFRGNNAFSEMETRAVSQYLMKIRKRVKLFITLHSFGQYILTPFSHRKTTYPHNIERLRNIAHQVAQRLEQFSGRFYDVGSAADLLYEAAGGSDDYAKAVLGIPYTFTIELPDEGRYGFLIPPEYILQIGREMWAALKEFIDNI